MSLIIIIIIILWWCIAVAVVAQTTYFVSASPIDRMPFKWYYMCGYIG